MKKALSPYILYLILLLLPALSFSQGTYQQVTNSGFEAYEGTGATYEPTGWNAFGNADGDFNNFVNTSSQLERSAETRPGSTGSYSLKLSSRMIKVAIWDIIANGLVTTGKINVGSTNVLDASNYIITQRGNDGYYHPFYDLPDSLVVWVKFKPQGAGISTTKLGAFIHGNSNLIVQSSGSYDANKLVGDAQMLFSENKGNNTWRRLSKAFEYKDTYVVKDPRYILLYFTTNQMAGEGAVGDELYIDDLELIYNKKIFTQNPSQREYLLDGQTMNIVVTCAVSGAMFPDNILTLQLSGPDGSFDSPVSIATLPTGPDIISGTNIYTLSGQLPSGLTAGAGYKVRVVSSNYYVEGSTSGAITVKNMPPTNLSMSVNQNTCHVTLKWNAPQYAGDTKYNIYRDNVLIASGVTEATYTDTETPPNVPHEWGVVAANYGAESERITITGTCNQVFIISTLPAGNGTITPSGNINVPSGNSQSFTFTPQQNYELTGILIDGEAVQESLVNETYVFNNVLSNHTLEARFNLKKYIITASASEGGGVSPEGDVAVSHGSNQTFRFIPATGYRLTEVLVDGESNTEAVANQRYTFENVTEEHAISALFSRIVYTITAVAETGGDIAPAGEISVVHGDSRTFVVTPDEGYLISKVLVNGENVPDAVASGSYEFSDVSSNQSIVARFELRKYPITAMVEGDGGAISPSGTINVEHGSGRTFTITPDEGYIINKVLVNGINNEQAVESGRYEFLNVTSAQSIVVEFALRQYIITATVEGVGGDISPEGAISVEHGANQRFVITPAEGYVISRVLVNGKNDEAAVASGNYEFVAVTSVQSIVVKFELRKYIITATVEGVGGAISPKGNINVEHGSNRSFTITADEGYLLSEVLVDGVSVPEAVAGKSYTFENVTSAHTIRVRFVKKQYIISVSAGAGGSITPAGEVKVEHGTNKSFVIAPNEGYRIEQVLLNNANNPSAVTNGTITVSNIKANHTLKATFSKIKYAIKATAGVGGAIYPSGTQEVEYGSNKTFTFSADEGYTITKVTVNGIDMPEAANSGSYTFSDIKKNQTIDVAFELITYTITASAEAGGVISPKGTVTVAHGGNQRFTITPELGYSIEQVVVDGINNPDAVKNGSYDFTNVTDNHTITASFGVSQYTITASAGPNGTISPEGTIGVSYGDVRTFVMKPALGYKIAQVLVNGENQPEAVETGTYTFNNIADNYTIAATFEFSDYIITASAGSGGAISPEGVSLVKPGMSITYTIAPDTGFGIDALLIDGESITKTAISPIYTFTDVSSNHSIEALFDTLRFHIVSGSNGGGSITPLGDTELRYGESQSYRIIPDEGYRIEQVLVDGINDEEAVSSGVYRFAEVVEDHTIEAVFEKIVFDITASAGDNGSITPSGRVSVKYGEDGSFSFKPNEGYNISRVLIDGVNDEEAVANGRYTFVNVRSHRSIVVEFEIKTYMIHAVANSNGGSISPSGAIEVEHGSTQSFVIAPDGAYKISEVLVDGINEPEAVATGGYTFVNITKSASIEVSFELLKYIVSATVDGGGGMVSPEGALSIEHGSSQIFTFMPDEGYEIRSVLIDGDNHPSAVQAGSYTLNNVTAPHSVIVSFKKRQYTVTANVEGTGGKIAPAGEVAIEHGASLTLAITPDEGYEISAVLVNGNNDPAAALSGSLTLDNITASYSVVATFKKRHYTIVATVDGAGGGTIAPEGETKVEHGASLSFTFTPDEGYEIYTILINGTNEPAAVYSGSYTLHHITGPYEVVASFKKRQYNIVAGVDGVGGSITPGTIAVEHGASATFHISADEGYRIKEVVVDETIIPEAATTGSFTFENVTESHSITVSFELLSYTIRASIEGEGGNIMPEGAVTVYYGYSQTFIFSAQTGYAISEVLVDNKNNPTAVAAGTYTFEAVTTHHEITIRFEKLRYTITGSVEGCAACAIEPNGETVVEYGDSHTIVVTTAEGYKLNDLLLDDTSVGAVEQYTIYNVSKDHHIRAIFEKEGVAIPTNSSIKTVLYPNPTTGFVHIENVGETIGAIKVFDIYGRLLQEVSDVGNTHTTLNLSSFEKGLYLIVIGSSTFKVMKR